MARDGVKPPEFTVEGLLYSGSLHALQGPPESGKTTLAVWLVLQLLQRGERVVYMDEESGAEQLVDKLLGMGAAPEDLEGLRYLEFEGRAWDDSDVLGFRDLLESEKPALIVFDSMAALLATSARDENAARDVRAFMQAAMLEPARDYGPAVVYVDHVTKAGDGGRYARGSGDKLAVVDVAWKVEPGHSFNRHTSGWFTLTHSKDRRGYLHRSFKVHVRAGDGRLTLELEQTEAGFERTTEGLSPAGTRMLAVLKAEPGLIGLTPSQIGDRVATDGQGPPLKAPTIRGELQKLSAKGLVEKLETTDSKGSGYWIVTAR
jgi:hypothetical protein